jgi:hypothetical protein
MEGKMEEKAERTGRLGSKHKQLLVYLTETRGYCKLKEEALDCTLWRTHFGTGYEACRKTDCRYDDVTTE